MQTNSTIITMESGTSSGPLQPIISTGFVPVQVIVYNTSPATFYYAQGSYQEQPGTAKPVPPNAYLALPFTLNATSFSLFWTSSTPLDKSYTVVVEWADEPLPMNFSALQAVVSFAPGTSVTISGTVTVTVENEPTVNISGTNNTVKLAEGTSVAIAGSVTVTGDVNIANTPTFNISDTGNTVQLAAGTSVSISGSVTVTGSVNIGNTPTFNISGTGNTVKIDSGTVVNIGTIAATVGVELVATGPVTIENTTSAPGIIQAASGSFNAIANFSVSPTVGSFNAFPSATTIISSGNYIISLFASVSFNNNTDPVTVRFYIGGSAFADFSLAASANLSITQIGNFGGGVSNTGISVASTQSSGSPASLVITGYGVLLSSTPPQKVAIVS